MIDSSTEQLLHFLIESNVSLLRQGLELLGRISDGEYVMRVAGQRISSHFRHVLEFYECFLDGLRRCSIDYDARTRDSQLEVDPGAASLRIRTLIARLTDSAWLDDSVLFVRIEDAQGAALKHDFVVSSLGRELQALNSHTVHHYGLIAIIARLLGIAVDEEFGLARSTLRYRAMQQNEAA